MASVAATADGVVVPARRRRLLERKSLVPLLLFLPPSVILFTVFVVLPMIDATTFSFFDWNGYGPITDVVGFVEDCHHDGHPRLVLHRRRW